MGALRQDINTKKIFYKPLAANELVLFDFNLSVGDTIHHAYRDDGIDYIYNPTDITVEKIDSVLVGTVYFKLFKLHNVTGDYIGSLIEGVGNTAGLFELLEGSLLGYNHLRCFSIKNITKYGAGQCILTTDVNEKNTIENSIWVFPNPTNGKVQLIVNKENVSFYEITNILGKCVAQALLINEKTEINIAEQKNGIYFLKVYDKNGNSMVKKL